ncbi:DUF998 domain-containing protein [Streptomyces flavofungini]|uniref:DUF998 domain-containing protein n=1 Tax=Streptomyces flavofungini TaxID=68200 RepID=UPI0034DE299E
MTSTKTDGPQSGGPRGRLRAAAPLLAAAAVLYNAWLLESLVPTGLDARHSYVSELYAADGAYRWLFGGLELVCATLVVAGAVLGATTAATGDRAARAGWWALAGLGVCSVADVLMPMTCTPSLRPGCRAVHPTHTLTSALVHCCLFASMALIVWAARRRGHPPLIARWGMPVAGAALVSSLCTVGPLIGHGGWHGVAQRCHLLLVGAWLALLAHRAWTARPVPDAPPGPPARRPAVGSAARVASLDGARDGPPTPSISSGPPERAE